MNQTQRNYTLKRLQEIAREAIRKLERDNRNPGVQLTKQRKIELISKGSVPFRADYANKAYSPQLLNCYDFSDYESEPYQLRDISETLAEIQAKLTATRDAVMLAGAGEARDALKEFTALMETF